jgi:hypothetical protein
MRVERRERIRALNDALRRHHVGGRIFISRDLVGRGSEAMAEALRAIQLVTEFNERNDPYGEHDFGSVEIDGERLFWKIDYYDESLSSHAVDPADPVKCTRVMTVMFAWEY